MYLFYYGLTCICDPMVDILIMCNCKKKPFLRHTANGTRGYSRGNERYLVQMDRVPVPTCKAFVRNIVVLFLALFHMY